MLKKIFYFLIFLFTKITIIPEKIILRKYSLNSIEFNSTVLAKYPTLIGRGAPRSYTTLTTTHNQTCAAILRTLLRYCLRRRFFNRDAWQMGSSQKGL